MLPSGDDLSIILFFLGLAVTALIGGLSLIERKRKAITVALIISALLFTAFALGWPWFETLSPKMTELSERLGTNPVAWFAIIMFLIALLLFSRVGDKPRTYSETFEKQKELIDHYDRKAELGASAPDELKRPASGKEEEKIEYFSDINIATDLPEIATFSAIASVSAEFVKVFLDYASFYRAMTSAGWTKKRRISLTRFDPLEKEMNYQVPLVSKIQVDEKTAQLKWGAALDDKDLISAEKYRASIVIVGPKGEQRFDFFLIKKIVNDIPAVVILNERDVSF